MFDAATGSVFVVQTKLPYGDPVKGMMLRMTVQATIECSPGEMMKIIVEDGVFVGDHLQMDRMKANDAAEYVWTRDPIAIPAREIGYLKPFRKQIIDER